MILSNKCLKQSGLSFLLDKKKSKKRVRVRTMQTLINKQKKLEVLYGTLYRRSEKLKAKEVNDPKRNSNKSYFCDKFPTYASYAKNYNLKQPTSAEPKKTITPKKKQVWGVK